MKNKLLFISSLCSIFILYYGITYKTICEKENAPGISAPFPPEQTEIYKESFLFKDYTITPMADFYIKAKILSKKYYSTDRESDLSPVDLAYGKAL